MERRLPFVIMKYEGENWFEDVFELAIKSALQNALDLSQDELLEIRSDIASWYGLDSTEELPSIPDRILDSIRDSLFVICDTTGNSPNCYFELGYALAHQKHIILIHRRGTEPPRFDIRGKPIFFYSGVLELEKKLEELIKYHYGERQSTSPTELQNLFPRLNLPLLPLEGDARYDYRLAKNQPPPITIDLVSTDKYEFPAKWDSFFQESLGKHLELHKQRGGVLFNGELVRVIDYHPGRDESSKRRFLRIEAEPTDYFSFIASNHCWKVMSGEALVELQEYEKQNLSNLRASYLANALSVCINIIVCGEGRERILIQERNTAKTFHGKQSFQCGAAGMVSATRDMRSAGIDVFASVKNEIFEELSISISNIDINFLGLIRETRLRDIALVGEVYVRADLDSLLSPTADAFELTRVITCDFSPEGFAKFLKDNNALENDAFAPLGIGAIIYSLIKRFPINRVERALTE